MKGNHNQNAFHIYLPDVVINMSKIQNERKSQLFSLNFAIKFSCN